MKKKSYPKEKEKIYPQMKKERKVKSVAVRPDLIVEMIANAEEQMSLGDVKSKIAKKLAYSFQSGGVSIDGLTFWGMKACAEQSKKGAWSPKWTKPEYQQFGEMIMLNIGCVNPKTKQIEWGNCSFSPKIRFAERTALTNAKRYALDKHISIPQKVAFVSYLKQYKPQEILQVSNTGVAQEPETFVVSDTGKVKSQPVKEQKSQDAEVL